MEQREQKEHVLQLTGQLSSRTTTTPGTSIRCHPSLVIICDYPSIFRQYSNEDVHSEDVVLRSVGRLTR